MFPYFDDDFLSFSNSVFSVPRINDPFECIYQSMNNLIRQTTEAFMADMRVLNVPLNHTMQTYAEPPISRVCERRIYHRPRRLQEYESNIRRRISPPSNTSGSSTRRAIQFLDQLPISTVQIKNLSTDRDKQTCSNNATENVKSSPEYSLILDRKAKCSKQNLIPIQSLCIGPNGRKPECDICLSEYESGHKLRHLPCGHGFHRDCIDTWLSTAETCPKCRKNVVGCLRRLQAKFAAGRSQSVARTNTNTSAILPNVRATNPDGSSQPPRQRPTVNVHQTRSSILRNRLAEQRRVAETQASFLPPFSSRSRLAVPAPTMLQMRRPEHVPGGRPHYQRDLVRSISSQPNKGRQEDALNINTEDIGVPQNAGVSVEKGEEKPAIPESSASKQPIALGYHEEKPVIIETPEHEARRMAVEAALKRLEIARNAAVETEQTRKQDS